MPGDGRPPRPTEEYIFERFSYYDLDDSKSINSVEER